jgi:glycosyltransferase involved in cell wall biosynthesis
LNLPASDMHGRSASASASTPALGPSGPRVALDVQALQVEGWADRGVGRYIVGYSTALARQGALAAALLAPELPPPSGLPSDLVAAGLVKWDDAATCRRLAAREPLAASTFAYHVTAPFLHIEAGAPAGLGVVEHWAASGVARVVLLHDLIPLRAPRHYLTAPESEARYRARAEWVAAADLVLTNSEYTRQEAIDLLGCDPARVVTVGVGVLAYFSPDDGTDEQLWRFHFGRLLGRPHLVTVGGSDARKGTDRAISALGLLVARGYDLSLLVVGHLTSAWKEQLTFTARASGVEDRVVLGGAVDDELLRACYRRAMASIMPSLAEGAGLPVLESAACGTPALASSTTALAETAVLPAALFDPTDIGDMADVIGAALDSDGRRAAILSAQKRVVAASTWDAVAGRALTALAGLAPSASRLASASFPGERWPPRLALVGWPADEVALAQAIAAAWDGTVDLVVDEPRTALPLSARPLSVGPLSAGPLSVGLPGLVLPPEVFGSDRRPASYDGVVYVLTGGPADGWVRARAGRYAGWLWLWDGAFPLRFALEPLVRRSAGLLVASEAARQAARLALRPLAAPPPLRLVTTDRAGPPELVGALTGLTAGASRGIGGAGSGR